MPDLYGGRVGECKYATDLWKAAFGRFYFLVFLVSNFVKPFVDTENLHGHAQKSIQRNFLPHVISLPVKCNSQCTDCSLSLII